MACVFAGVSSGTLSDRSPGVQGRTMGVCLRHVQQPASSSCLGRSLFLSRITSRQQRRRPQRLCAVPAKSSPTASQEHEQHAQSSSRAQLLTLVETHDRRKVTYSWPSHGQSSSRSAGIAVQHEQQDDDQSGQQLLSQLPGRQQLLDSIKALYLPAGYPSSVTDDYLAYQLCTVPVHITGWLSISLTTSSLLKAVGVNAGPVGATAAAAAIKWIVKDGIGAAGRLLVGGKLGLEFDDDPRRWRMMAEALTTAGLAMEIATAVFPANFLVLASLGNFSKAVGKGMGKPVFRVIQTHFAASGNVGAVAAKEEVWEVSAQLTGYALSVMLLQALQETGNWQTVVGIWALVQGVHVAARYWALTQLRFRYLNQKRACILTSAHVQGLPLPSIADCNKQEPMLVTALAMRPCIAFGCSLEQAWGIDTEQLQPQQLLAWVGVYTRQEYLLMWRQRQAYVVIKQDCQQLQQALLQATWQAAWLEAHDEHDSSALSQQQQQPSPDLALMQASVEAMEQQFGAFLAEAHSLGWNTDFGVFKVGRSRLQV